MSNVSERNAVALADAIRKDREKFDALRERLEHLERQVAMYASGVDLLRQQLVVLQAARGRGPTTR